MREILFRAKRIDNREWVEGYFCRAFKWTGDNAPVPAIQESGCFMFREIDPETLCQYTGLTDKNGKRIWENDIVKYQVDNDDCPFPNKDIKKRIGRVYFEEFRAAFALAMGQEGSSMINNDLYKYVQNGNRVEVIGNIFDNPELLKEE